MSLLYTCGPDFVPVPESDVLRWSEWMMKDEHRRVAKTAVMECEVSTVFLGVKTCSNRMDEGGVDWMFETMVFGPDAVIAHLSELTDDDVSIFAKAFGGADFQRRYRTVEDARAGHAEIVALVRRALAERN